METRVVETDGSKFVECRGEIEKIDDATELITACFEGETRLLLIESRYLPESFFDLSTRFAGEFLQKLQNYHIRTAVFVENVEYTEKFKQFKDEARRGKMFGVFSDRADAEGWLTSE